MADSLIVTPSSLPVTTVAAYSIPQVILRPEIATDFSSVTVKDPFAVAEVPAILWALPTHTGAAFGTGRVFKSSGGKGTLEFIPFFTASAGATMVVTIWRFRASVPGSTPVPEYDFSGIKAGIADNASRDISQDEVTFTSSDKTAVLSFDSNARPFNNTGGAAYNIGLAQLFDAYACAFVMITVKTRANASGIICRFVPSEI